MLDSCCSWKLEIANSFVITYAWKLQNLFGVAPQLHELEQVQQIVQDQINERLPVCAKVVPLAQAQAISTLRAVFGESYPDPVRVVCIGEDVTNVVGDPGAQGGVQGGVRR